MTFIRTTAIDKLLSLKKRIKIIQGGTSAGKTYGIIPVLIDYAIKNPHQKITVVAETLPAVKEGPLDIFKSVMIKTNRWIEKNYKESPSIQYKFTNGTVIQFKSFDSVGKAKAAGKRDVLFLNEVNHIPFEIVDALIVRSELIWMDFNPDNEFFVHTHYINRDDADFLVLTYEDNEAIPPGILDELKLRIEWAKSSPYWANWVKVYIKGEVGQLQEVIFSGWTRVKERPERFQNYIYGLDFGYTHPLALVRVYYYESEIFIEPVVYKSKLTTPMLIEEMNEKNVELNIEIMADPARPEMISELIDKGFTVLKANKAVQYGFDAVRSVNVFYSDDFVHNEYINYKHKKINDKVTDDPVKINDDIMDASRYAIVYIKENFIGDSSYFGL